MIATILPSSANFHAVEYNERKVRQGKAELIEMANFGYLEGTDAINAASLRDYLVNYSAKNENIKKTQFHVAISCKGASYTPEQLVDIAHKWLKEMGYGEDGQPLLIYAHHDTKNTHIHIVTSRVAPDGHKINDHNERRRSQAILNRIMGVDRERETKEIMKKAFQYSFSTLGQYQAILESSGYECYKEDDNLNIKKDGVVIDHLPIAEIEAHFKNMDKKATEKRRKQLKAILMKYRDMSSNKEELLESLRQKFGIDIIFNGKKDSPYGYMLVDHKDKVVYKGSDILPIKELLKFTSHADRSPEKVLEFIKAKLQEQPEISTFEMSQLLRQKFDAYIRTGEEFTSRNSKKSGTIVMGHHSYALDQDIYDKLRYNGRMKWMQSFHPSSVEEKAVLMKFGHIEDSNAIHVEDNVDRSKIEVTLAQIDSILSTTEGSVFDAFHENKLMLYRQDDKFFVLDMQNKTIVDLQKEAVDTSRFVHATQGQNRQIGQKRGNGHAQGQGTANGQSAGQTGNAVNKVLKPTGGRGSNREWEVGNNGRWDDVDDERTLKR